MPQHRLGSTTTAPCRLHSIKSAQQRPAGCVYAQWQARQTPSAPACRVRRLRDWPRIRSAGCYRQRAVSGLATRDCCTAARDGERRGPAGNAPP